LVLEPCLALPWQVTVSGINFGPVDLSVEVQIGVTPCLSSSWVTDSSVKCRLPAGSGLRLTNTVLASNMVGTAMTIFSYDSAIVTFISPWNGPTTTGASEGGCR
jgi:hypothetical protein